MRVFLDSSSYAKRFVAEEGSDIVREILDEASGLGLSVICLPEIVSALRRRQSDRQMTRGQYDDAKGRLLESIRDADVIDLTPTVVGVSIDVLESSRIRGMDALHVACAIEWEAELFISSDRRQIAAARKAGLKTRSV